MLKRLVPLLVLIAGAALLIIPSSAQAQGTQMINMSSFRFQPSDVTVKQGTTVTWTNMEFTTHTSTSNQKFWNSGDVAQVAPFVEQDAFLNAGTYAYYCSYHKALNMVGRIRVPMIKTPSAAGGYTIRWSSAATTPVNRNFDVQIKRPGSTWKDFKMATTARAVHFNPAKTGTYHFQARTRNTANNKPSLYSPPLSVTI